jgi:hypothetical protein
MFVAAPFTGCGDDAADRGPPPTRFRTALESVGGGAEGTESGFGWVDVEALRERGHRSSNDLDWAAGALGPGAEQLADGPGPARVGIEPARARQILSLVGSYAIGVRFDRVETARLERALGRRARPHDHGPWTFYDLSDTPAIPFGTPLEGLTELASHAAVMPGAAVLARFELARPALTGEGASPVETPLMAAATSCLGDVVAARTVPNNFTYLGSEAPRLFAFGVELTDAGPRDILCILDESGAVADDAAAGMRDALNPGATDAVSGEPMSGFIESVAVERLEIADVEAARAELVPAPGEDPGFLFRVFARGSTLTYVGLREPYPGNDAGE